MRPLPPIVAGSWIGFSSVPFPVFWSTVKICTTSPWSPFVGPSVGELPFGVPLTYAAPPFGANATPP